ncbi:unnamed protein product [Spirodela intermedia]|uniref:Uncharacterized protein n=2 Tax=Spirodela intermedia TaxID=51605 RepID=A0A7I8JKG0_SPIIN|nr:unnamed protein product [Spirodela intermedia]CAA6669932.1 unnamed protein product [Spirodela intermedia]CAA7406908.1 unnamed protein product [Spirodela intermedia]
MLKEKLTLGTRSLTQLCRPPGHDT